MPDDYCYFLHSKKKLYNKDTFVEHKQKNLKTQKHIKFEKNKDEESSSEDKKSFEYELHEKQKYHDHMDEFDDLYTKFKERERQEKLMKSNSQPKYRVVKSSGILMNKNRSKSADRLN